MLDEADRMLDMGFGNSIARFPFGIRVDAERVEKEMRAICAMIRAGDRAQDVQCVV